MIKNLLCILVVLVSFSSKAQWTTISNTVFNTNAGAVAVVKNPGATTSQIFVVNPKGAGTMTLGEANTGAGGYTSLSLGISAQSGGYTYLSAVKSAGSSYGVISLNPWGGNVGIGTTDPGSFKLAVEGKIGAREIQVTNANPWPDYVFNKNYHLPSLVSLEQYIKTNGHLPNVPSAEIVARDGIALGEMNRILLEKIEELTLYIIEIKKENDDIKNKIELISEYSKNNSVSLK